MRDIRQLHGQRRENQQSKDGSLDTYELQVLSRDGDSRVLVGQGLVDEPVPGELKS
jgi:hypothetical protein